MDFTLEATGIQPVHTRLLNIHDRALSLKPVMRTIAMRLEGEIEKQFATEGANFGQRWKPLAESTIAQKIANNYPLDILVAKGDLKRSFRQGGENNIFELTDHSARVGSADPKAIRHQKGTSRMPARPMTITTKAVNRDASKRIHTFIVTGRV